MSIPSCLRVIFSLELNKNKQNKTKFSITSASCEFDLHESVHGIQLGKLQVSSQKWNVPQGERSLLNK